MDTWRYSSSQPEWKEENHIVVPVDTDVTAIRRRRSRGRWRRAWRSCRSLNEDPPLPGVDDSVDDPQCLKDEPTTMAPAASLPRPAATVGASSRAAPCSSRSRARPGCRRSSMQVEGDEERWCSSPPSSSKRSPPLSSGRTWPRAHAPPALAHDEVLPLQIQQLQNHLVARLLSLLLTAASQKNHL